MWPTPPEPGMGGPYMFDFPGPGEIFGGLAFLLIVAGGIGWLIGRFL